MRKISENNGTEKIGLVTPTPEQVTFEAISHIQWSTMPIIEPGPKVYVKFEMIVKNNFFNTKVH